MTKEEREKAIATYTKRFKCREKTVEECEGIDCGECPLFYDDDELHEAERIALEALKQDQAADMRKEQKNV